MRPRYYTIGTLATTLVVFVWQTLSNTVLYWHTMTMRPFDDAAMASQTLRSIAPANGVYFAPQGILAAVSLTTNGQPKSMAPMMGRQVVLDLIVVFIVAFLVLRLPAGKRLRTGITAGLFGFAAAAVLALSDWNWYGFAFPYSVVNVLDITVQLFLAGVLLETFRGRWTMPAPRSEFSSVPMQGGLPSLRTGAPSRP